jgi:HEAT repeat protein
MDFFNFFRPNIEKSIALGNVRKIIRALRNPDPVVQRKAAAALADLTPHEAVKPLLHSLLSPDRDVRRLSAMALGNIGDTTASSGLVTALGDTDPRVRLEVAEALGKIRDPIAVDALLQCLEDSNADVRMNTIWALGWMNDEKIIPRILPLLSNPDRGTRLRTAEALENLNGVPSNPEDKAFYYIAKNEWDKIPLLREAAIKPLVWVLTDDYYDIRIRAARTLGKIRSPIAVEALNKALFDPEECVSIEAVEALSSIGSKEAIHSLVEGLASPFKSTRLLAGAALERLGWKPAHDLKKKLETSDREEWDICSSMRGVSPNTPLVSKGSAVTARTFTEFATSPKFFTGPTPERPPIPLRGSQNPADTTETMRLHDMSSDTRSIDPLITIPDDLDQGTRQQRIQDLSQLKIPRVVESLIRALETDDTVLLKEALRGLGAIKRPASIASIARAARHPDKNVRLGAIVALGIISRKTRSDQFPAAGTGKVGEEMQNTTGNLAADALLELKRSSPLIAVMTSTLSHPYAYMRRGAADVLQIIGWKPGNDNEQLLFNAAHPSGDEWTDILKKDRGPGGEIYDESTGFADDIIAKMADPQISTEKKEEYVQQMRGSLIAWLEDTNPEVRKSALKVLSHMQPALSNQILIPLLQDSDSEVRALVASKLEAINWHPENEDQSMMYLFAQKKWTELGKTGQTAVRVLTGGLTDRDPDVRRASAELLGATGGKTAVSALMGGLHDEDHEVRFTSLRTILKNPSRDGDDVVSILKKDRW